MTGENRMNVIVFLDEKGGLLFHGRRQSRDRVLPERIGRLAAGRRLWMNGYSYKIYSEVEQAKLQENDKPQLNETKKVQIQVAEDFMAKAQPGDFCLVETEMLKAWMEQIERLIVFRWNRNYPADVFFDLDLTEWQKISAEEFPGYSHEKITEEIFEKK